MSARWQCQHEYYLYCPIEGQELPRLPFSTIRPTNTTSISLTWPSCTYVYLPQPTQDKGLVINYGEGGGLQNGKIAGPKLFAPPLNTG